MTIIRSLCAATAVLAVALTASPATAGETRQTKPLVNRGFEAGMSNWTCTPGSAAVVTSPVHTGSRALAGEDNAYCAQTMKVVPDITYRVTAWVWGRYVRMGVRGHAPARKPGGDDWYQLQFEFRAGPTQTTATFYFAGTRGRPYGADAISVEVVCPADDPDDPLPVPCPSLFWP